MCKKVEATCHLTPKIGVGRSYLQAVVTGEENGTIILWDLTRGVVP